MSQTQCGDCLNKSKIFSREGAETNFNRPATGLTRLSGKSLVILHSAQLHR